MSPETNAPVTVTRISRRELLIYESHGLVGDAEAEALESAEMQHRIRRIRRLHRDLGLSYDVIGLVMPLVERLEVLEARLRGTTSAD
jgi:hypothetical protein